MLSPTDAVAKRRSRPFAGPILIVISALHIATTPLFHTPAVAAMLWRVRQSSILGASDEPCVGAALSRAEAALREGLPPAVEGLFVDADHVDVKTAVGEPSLRQFVAAAMSWQPAWVRLLFRGREVLARLLGLDHPDMPSTPTRLRPDQVSFAPGATVWFFTVIAGVDGHYIVLEAADNHLTGVLAIVCEPAASTTGENRFRVITIVRYHRWTGRLYFAVVRPFHHLVVASMTRGATASSTVPEWA